MNDLSIFNIRDFIHNDSIGEEKLQGILSDFVCDINSEIETFLINNSIEFCKKNQSVTYIIATKKDSQVAILGYFTLTIKPITISKDLFSNNMNRKIERVSSFDADSNSYSLAAYLIAQLGKNYKYNEISGEQILRIALDTIKELQYNLGGMVVFLEAENKDKLKKFYENNGFRMFNTKTRPESHDLIQYLKII